MQKVSAAIAVKLCDDAYLFVFIDGNRVLPTRFVRHRRSAVSFQDQKPDEVYMHRMHQAEESDKPPICEPPDFNVVIYR